MSMKLVILGLLMEGDSHPYEIKQTMKERAMHHFVKIQDGSLYYAMDQLRKDNLVEAVEVIKDTNRPDKTIYRITEAGKEKFQDLLLRQFEGEKQIVNPIHIALRFARFGDQRRIAAIIKRKVEEQKINLQQMKDLYEEHVPIVSRSVLHMMRGNYEHMLTELRWLQRLLKDAEEGILQTRGTPLDVTWDE
jgi:DNA-binding PadR family transcriptional regulator